jgi:hypothetical protein
LVAAASEGSRTSGRRTRPYAAEVDVPDLFVDLAFLLTIFSGPALMFVALFRLSTARGIQRGYTSPLRERANRQRLRRSMQTEGPLPAEQIPALQAFAQAKVAQREWWLFAVGASLMQISSLFMHPGPIRLTVSGLVVALFAWLAITGEQQARLGIAFLQSYPVPERSQTG